MWVLLSLGAATLASFNPIIFKRMLKELDIIVIVWAVHLLALPLLGLFTYMATSRLPGFDWLFVFGTIGSAGLNSVAHLAFTRALKLADASLVTPLLIFSPVFTVLISALFLGEIPSVKGMFGVGLVLIGAYWLTLNSSAGLFAPLKSLTQTSSNALVLLAGLLWAITPLIEKIAIQHTYPENPRFTALVVITLLLLILTPAVVARGKSSINKLSLHRRDLIIAGLIAGIAPVLGYTALSLGFVGYVTTLFKLSTILTVLWSFLFLKESGIGQRLPASLLMVLGAVLIAT